MSAIRKEKPLSQRLFCCCCRPTTLPPEVYTGGSSILYSEEGIDGALLLRNFKSPGKRSSYRYTSINAAMAITSTHWLCYTNHRPMIRVEWTDERLTRMEIDTIDGKQLLVIRWDASLFQESWSGQMELRLRVQDPVDCQSEIQEQISKHIKRI
jgi:hypothetical protein